MSTDFSSGTPTPSSNPAPEAPLAPNFEDQLREFWIKYSRGIYILIAVVLIGIVVRGAYGYYLVQQEKATGEAYNAAGNSTEKLRSFAASHEGHILAGVALLRVADEAYSNSKYSEAVTSYQKAASYLKDGVFGGRALVGAALSQVLAGQSAEGEKSLKAIAIDAKQLKPVRAEAAYHAGVIASDAGRNDEANKLFEQAAAIDPTSVWAQRATMKKGASK